MQDEKKTGKKKSEKKIPNIKNLNIRMPKMNRKGKAAAEPEKGEQKPKTKKVPKRNSIAVSSGKKKKKLVSGSLQKTEYTSEESLKKETAADPERTGKRRSSGKSNTEKRVSSSSRAALKKDRERQEQRKARLEARKAELFKQRLIIGVVAVCILLAIILLTACPGKKKGDEPVQETAVSGAEEEVESGGISGSEVRHFSFRMLLSDEMAVDDSVLTVNQFREILQQLYDANYILVDYYSIAGIKENEDGTTEYTDTELNIPPGKIPFVLSQRDVSYTFDRIGKGYASKLIVAEDGQLTNEYLRADGAQLRGSYDIVPILEEFIAEHPDFAYENARGILGLTGYNGILGYRTSELLGKAAEEGNPYAGYGIFDVNAEIDACKPVVDALKSKGWHLASYGNNYCSYGAEYAMMTSDMDTWMANVSDLIGGTDLLIFPCETDIGNWSEYKPENQKYQYLKGLGFDHFCIEEKNNPSWLQIRPDYVRQGIKEIDCYDDFAQIMGMQ